MARQLVSQGEFAAAPLAAGFVDVATLAAPSDPLFSYRYTLVMRFVSLAPGHYFRFRAQRGVAVTTYDEQPGNGQTADEVEVEEFVAHGEDAVAIAVSDQSGLSDAVGGQWYLYREDGPADPAAPANAGFFAKESIMRLTAGDAFDQEFNLTAGGLEADPALVALAQSLADRFVDGEAWKLRLPFPPEPDAMGHAVRASDEPLYSSLCLWASRWARAQGHLIRGERGGGMGEDVEEVGGGEAGGGADDVEGSLTRMRSEAERRIVQLLKAQRERQRLADATRHTGIGVLSCLDGRAFPGRGGTVGPFA